MIKIGTDICSVVRVEDAYKKHGQRFLDRVLTESEQAYVLKNRHHTATRIAARFAAKEAVAKALGTGMAGFGWKEVEVSRQRSGEPSIVLHGRAAEIAKEKGLKFWQLSITHEREYAVAFVIAHNMED